ncbi:hypothetical protein ATE84_2334 [Aquimarina sp. MAR_2010_214]|uniref:hypothetical protein n=1 Tax=Aquimarina sp. MAR_2010_214 TaxID=1250026 RepID=UPI000C708508|nr:hypothetical protein [Aquimarina sp. MAR_2010_214]PKV50279.1 hypothetical protein ATE84_2334 [Aquimarina sp. MAR_2010_214]
MKKNIFIKALEIGYNNPKGISYNKTKENLNYKFDSDLEEFNFKLWFYHNFFNDKTEPKIISHKNSSNPGYQITFSSRHQLEPFDNDLSFLKGEALNKYIDFLELERTRKSSRKASWFSLIAIIFAAIGIIVPQYCNNKTSDQTNNNIDPKQTKFEKILGKENSETLDYLVSNFENDFLKNLYPNLELEQAYKRFLTELKDNKTDHWREISKKSKIRFQKSKLKLEIYSYPDSVWIEKDTAKLTLKSSPMIKRRYKYLTEDGTFEYRNSESSFNYKKGANIDSIIELQKTWRDINYVGKFWKALKETGNDNDFIIKYLDMINVAGPIQPELMTREMLDFDIDYSDYLIKRIIVTEFAY